MSQNLSDPRYQGLLRYLASRIEPDEIVQLVLDEVFEYDHMLRASTLLEPLGLHAPPNRNFYDYQFLISELGILIRDAPYSCPMRVYLAVTYTYCEAMENKIGDDDRYYIQVLNDLVQYNDRDFAQQTLLFWQCQLEEGNWTKKGAKNWLLLAIHLCIRIATGGCEGCDGLEVGLSEIDRDILKSELVYSERTRIKWLTLNHDIPDVNHNCRDLVAVLLNKMSR
jgi:hypothetical protein